MVHNYSEIERVKHFLHTLSPFRHRGTHPPPEEEVTSRKLATQGARNTYEYLDAE